MAKQARKQTVDHVFSYTSEAELDTQIQAFKAAHADAHGEGLALDSKRPLGPGKARLSFRVVELRHK
ncbi:MAG: hypothetical protein KC431_20600 [Myxococcales bacterium]|nr:hypothetical protein [Myxococcales bacterium]